MSQSAAEQADSGWDSYNERVLRNEGELRGLTMLVRETRDSDRALIEQRSESLRQELLRAKEADAEALALLREVYDTAIQKNYEQSDVQIRAQDERSVARWKSMEQLVSQWRKADEKARLLQADEYARRLDVLNGEHDRIAEVLAQSVTREVFGTTIQAIEDKIAVIDRALLLMPTNLSLAVTIQGLSDRLDQSAKTLGDTANARLEVLNEKLGDQKDRILKIEQTVATTKDIKGVTMSQVSVLIAALGFALTVIVLIVNYVTSGAP